MTVQTPHNGSGGPDSTSSDPFVSWSSPSLPSSSSSTTQPHEFPHEFPHDDEPPTPLYVAEHGTGLLFVLSTSTDGAARILPVSDARCPTSVHPHACAPSSIVGNGNGEGNNNGNGGGVHILAGGGSGVAVFRGVHPDMGSLVMKHGGHKDTSEAWALASIDRELVRRRRGRCRSSSNSGSSSGTVRVAHPGDNAVTAAAERMRTRIPEFRFLYVSPRHFRDRTAFLWSVLRQTVMNPAVGHESDSEVSSCASEEEEGEEGASEAFQHLASLSKRPVGGGEGHHGSSDGSSKSIRLFARAPDGGDASIVISRSHVDIYLGPNAVLEYDDDDNKCNNLTSVERRERGAPAAGRPSPRPIAAVRWSEPHRGYDSMSSLLHSLRRVQKNKLLKVTQAQKAIGGPRPTTASSLLVSGKLTGDLLNKLQREFSAVVRDIKLLTLDEEKRAVDQVREELGRLDASSGGGSWTTTTTTTTTTAADVSDLANEFTGHAIRKNFHPDKGRMIGLRSAGDAFRSYNDGSGCSSSSLVGELVLAPDETVPATFLGKMLRRGACIEDAFDGAPFAGRTALDVVDGGDDGDGTSFWRELLRQAINVKSRSALERVWTAGLTDAGLHNMFLRADDRREVMGRRGGGGEHLWLFDLGEAGLQPLPAFLTKFLMSFFHALGMEETEDGNSWVNRFEISTTSDGGTKLQMTNETVSVLSKASDAYRVIVNHLLVEFFDGEEDVRRLLTRYVVLQLLSDAAFCLERWQTKGGGKERIEGGTEGELGKWLWRALWDVFVATYVHNKF